jgi:hypothetical protein
MPKAGPPANGNFSEFFVVTRTTQSSNLPKVMPRLDIIN